MNESKLKKIANEDNHLDAAGKSLADALRVSLGVLKLVMVVLLVLFMLSGTRNVDEGKLAVRILFGAIQGAPGEQVLEPGGPYFTLPEPIGGFLEIDTTLQQITLEKILPLQPFQPGDYVIHIRVTDHVGQQTIEPTASFKVQKSK